MKELKQLICELNTDTPIENTIPFLVDNDWFGEVICKKNGRIMLTEAQAERFSEKLRTFLYSDETSIDDILSKKLPETYRLFQNFISETKSDEETNYHIADFMAYRLHKELFFYTDKELDILLSNVAFELIKAHGDIFTFFIAWLKLNHKTAYKNDYVLNKRYTMDIQNEAYDFDDWMQLAYYLFYDDYIEDNEMFEKAAESKHGCILRYILSVLFV